MWFQRNNNEKSTGRDCSLLLNPITTLITRSQGWLPVYCLLFITDFTLILTSEFKEAFPAGRFRPVCKIQAKRGASSAAVADQIKPPEWWHSTHIIQAFDGVLQDKVGHFSLQ
jgi:hypothetical protein